MLRIYYVFLALLMTIVTFSAFAGEVITDARNNIFYKSGAAIVRFHPEVKDVDVVWEGESVGYRREAVLLKGQTGNPHCPEEWYFILDDYNNGVLYTQPLDACEVDKFEIKDTGDELLIYLDGREDFRTQWSYSD